MNEHDLAQGSRVNAPGKARRPVAASPDATAASGPRPKRVAAKKPPEKRPEARAAAPRAGKTERRPAARRNREERNRILSLGFGLLFLVCLVFSMVNLHPTTATSASKAAQATLALSAPNAAPFEPEEETEEAESIYDLESSEVPAQEATETAETATATETVHYTIPDSALAAQRPRKSCYGEISVDKAYRIPELFQMARDYGLLGPDERMVFDPNANFYRGGDAKKIQFYLDETILVILWKEEIEGNCVSLAEIRVADASQFRRKLAGDSFGSNSQYYASELARSVNAVVAMNADFYLFRDLGIVVYNRQLYRCNTQRYHGVYKYNCVDTMFVAGNGDLLYRRVGEPTTKNDLRQFLQENDVIFSIAFGPVLVENGRPVPCKSYPLGEVTNGFSRAGIGQVDTLHYLYMVLSHSPEKKARWTVNTFAKHFAEKGVRSAYCLDGGQTGEVVFKGEPYNHIDFFNERQVSDILYFGSALPPEGGGAK